MTNAYNPESWHELFVMLGGAVAVLIGLLFIAISIHISEIEKAPHWRIRAFSNIFALTGLLIEATLVLMPQDRMVLGTELIIVNLFLLFFLPVRLFVHLFRLDANIPKVRLIYGSFAWLLGAGGGAGLIAEIGGGMYLVVASCLGIIWLSVLNAWSLMTASYQK
jgi:hypothetical protein